MGNETSQQQVKYGTTLENDMVVTWKTAGETPAFAARDGHCAAAVGGKMYVFGGVVQTQAGQSQETNELLVFDLETQNWSKADVQGDIPEPRSAATLASVDNKILLFGGLSQESGWFEEVYSYNTETNTWTKVETTGAGPSARDKLCSAVIDKNIYIFGGFGPQLGEEEQVEEFDEEQDEDDIPDDQEGAQFGWFNDLYIFNTENNSWSSPMHMNMAKPTPRAAAGMCAVNNYLVIFGGRDAEGRKNDIHIFSTATRKWETQLKITGRAPEPRSFHTLTSVGNSRVVVLGGRGRQEQHFQEIHIFDTATHQWLQPTLKGVEFPARGVHTAVVVGDHFVVFGGSSDFSPELMQCSTYFNNAFMIKTDEFTTGRALDSGNEENVDSNIEVQRDEKRNILSEANTNATMETSTS